MDNSPRIWRRSIISARFAPSLRTTGQIFRGHRADSHAARRGSWIDRCRTGLLRRERMLNRLAKNEIWATVGIAQLTTSRQGGNPPSPPRKSKAVIASTARCHGARVFTNLHSSSLAQHWKTASKFFFCCSSTRKA